MATCHRRHRRDRIERDGAVPGHRWRTARRQPKSWPWNTLHRVGAVSLVVLVGAQAVIAGQHIFGDWGIGVHAGFGNTAFTIAVLMTVAAWWQLDGGSLRIVGVAIVVLVSAQIGLG
jgi:hypothetical protein